MPMAQLVDIFQPELPDNVVQAGHDLHYRDFLTVALVIPESLAFPDNWIYIHASEVKVGRIQNFGSWSPYLVKEGRTCLGLEYFVFEGDELWSAPDDELIARGKRELAPLSAGNQLVVGCAPELVALEDEVLQTQTGPALLDEIGRPRSEILDSTDLHLRGVDVDPIVRKGQRLRNHQGHREEISIVEVVTGLDDVVGQLWLEDIDQLGHGHRLDDVRRRLH